MLMSLMACSLVNTLGILCSGDVSLFLWPPEIVFVYPRNHCKVAITHDFDDQKEKHIESNCKLTVVFGDYSGS